MADQQFREIQLSGKHLVFIFMTSVVLAVAVFLLGVSVGRGVRANVADLDIADQVAVAPPADLPPPTEIAPADTTYHDDLLGTATPPAEPEPVAEPVADAGDDPQGEAPAVEPPAADPPAPRVASASSTDRPAAAPAPAAPAATAASPTTPAWFLQVGAYSSQPNAARQAADLTAKGYPASVLAPEKTGGLHRVRLGPFGDRTDATRTQSRLRSEEGLTSSLTR